MATHFLASEDLLGARILCDTAALVLIWLVQLVVYPAFLHFHREGFRVWHREYTRRVTYVVLPIMFGQLALYGWLGLTAMSWDIGLNLALILIVWAITFFRAVPLHGALDVDEDHLPLSARLVAVNWWRTVIWTVVWGVTTAGLLV